MSKDKIVKLNLGCGFHHYEGWLNVDKQEACEPDMQVDLEETPWPFEDNSVSEVRLIHTLEHLGQDPRTFVAVMAELYRVCRHGAHVHILSSHPRHESFLSDPTATRAVTVNSMQFFDRQVNEQWKERGVGNTPVAMYENLDFRIINYKLVLDENFTRHAMAKKWSNADLRVNINLYNNAIAATEIHLVVMKDKEDDRFALATPLNMEPYLMAVYADVNAEAHVSRSIAQTGQWEPTESTVISRILKKTSAERKRVSVLNLGANVGWYALLAARSAANVFVDCYEPQAENRRLLERNITMNDVADRVTVNPLAVTDVQGKAQLYIGAKDRYVSSLVSATVPEEGRVELEVDTDCLDGILKGKQLARMPNVLIMDVGGCEQKVINGGARVFERGWRPVIFTKFQPSAIAAAGAECDMFKKLSEMKYQLFVISAKALNLTPVTAEQLAKYYVDLNKPKTRDRYFNVLALPEGVDVKQFVG